MEIWEWIVLGVAVAAAVLLALAFVRARQRRTHLKDRFLREYQRTVEIIPRSIPWRPLAETLVSLR